MKFTLTSENVDQSKATLEFTEVCLPEVLEQFKNFLQASGFSIGDKNLVLEEEDDA